MNMQIAITGRGGQGVLFLSRILAECALELGQEVISSETHGMAMRGGSIISTLKVGPYKGPLIRSGQANVMLVLDDGSLETFSHFLSPDGTLFLNAPLSETYPVIDASELAVKMGSPLVSNLILLGFALSRNKLFCRYQQAASVTKRISPYHFREINGKALKLGYSFGYAEE